MTGSKEWKLVWVCDNPHCPVKLYDELTAKHHEVASNHTMTKCRRLITLTNKSKGET